jgi:membrane associated rhomboid family serine protease
MSYPTDDSQPVFIWRRIPVYGATLLVALHMIAFVFTTLSIPLGLSWISAGMVFSSASVIQDFAIWQVFTYAFVHQPSLWFLVEMAMLFYLGLEVEKFLGRCGFFVLYALLILLPPLFFIALGILGNQSILQGASAVHFAIFAAFATIYPDARFLFNLTARAIAIVFFTFNSLVLFSGSAWTALSALWLDTAAMLLFMRIESIHSLQGVLFKVPSFRFSPRSTSPSSSKAQSFSSQSPLDPLPSSKSKSLEQEDPMCVIDPILEKIARHGLSSLTESEKKRLENARAELVKREKSR